MNTITSEHKHGQGRTCVITRRALFSASHRYWLPELSTDDNSKHFGACAIAPGHGHNYELIVSMEGTLNADGMVLNLSEIKHAIKEKVTNQLDFRFLNETWPEFDISKANGCLPTTEALTRVIWSRLESDIPLKSLRLYENQNLWADYLGNNMEAYITIKSHFAAAHRLAREELSQAENEAIYGKCARTNGHGHNYLVEITVKGNINSRTGMICDLGSLQQLVEDLVVEPFDHTFLNKDIKHFSNCVPTAENIALHISDKLKYPIQEIGASLHKVRLQESPNNAAEIYSDSSNLIKKDTSI
ncbi:MULTISPECIES: 6-pyruvoyl trahydropterin synthase family protein [unclassified Prochlorococcus]|uniref:6-pyruvoyl trahydropterin synthase family protein n=1 Tax=unclassified Prochlorococcus TaxID=2627481 RepID=UPI0005337135|nr:MULTISPECIES: 6-carboxytetrahydropterin synthase [unclassified Prochlorococcus]KGG18197.1 6-pyruvoyl tetrahydrobiopterin synthase [Prochlorococcus sp. MIT 0603]